MYGNYEQRNKEKTTGKYKIRKKMEEKKCF